MASPAEEVAKPKTVSPQAMSHWEPPVTCAVCGGELKDPYLLACLHCLCRECLPRAAREDGRLKCPHIDCGDCSTTWRKPDVVAPPRCEERSSECVPVQCATVGRYVEGKKIIRKVSSGERISCGNTTCESPNAEATVFCCDCWLFFCNSCLKSHKALEGVIGKHKVSSVEAIRSGTGEGEAALLRKAVPLSCPHHKGEVFKYHCKLCDVLICQACTVDKDSPHRPAYLSAEVPLPPQHLQAMELAQKVVTCSKEECRLARETAEGWGNEVERKKETALRDTRQAFQAIRATLDHREEALCEQIRAVSETRKVSITDTIHLYRQKEETLSNKQAMLSFLSTEGSPHEVITYRRVVGAGPTHRRSDAAVSCVMQFVPKQEAALQEAIEGFGRIEVGACPANCTLKPTPDKVHKCFDSDPLVFTLTTVDQEKTSCSVGGDIVQAFLRPRPPIPGPPIKAAVNDEENGQYKVTFDLTYTRECELSVLVNGAHIQGSPFALEPDPVSEVPFLLTRDVNTLVACNSTLKFPQQPGYLPGVTVAPSGIIFVTDFSNHKVNVFDNGRNFVRSFGQQGVGDGQLLNPKSVVATSKELVYVASDNGVDVLTENGDFVRRIGTGILDTPWDVAVHYGEIFVADSSNNRVAVFSQEGELVRTIGSAGSGPGQFQYPAGVAISPDGDLYISDCRNHRVQVLTTQGVFVREFGKEQLTYPNKLQFTVDKHVLVADRYNNRIAVFTQDGAWVTSVACAGHPVGLAADRKGDLLVACYNGGCVRIV